MAPKILSITVGSWPTEGFGSRTSLSVSQEIQVAGLSHITRGKVTSSHCKRWFRKKSHHNIVFSMETLVSQEQQFRAKNWKTSFCLVPTEENDGCKCLPLTWDFPLAHAHSLECGEQLKRSILHGIVQFKFRLRHTLHHWSLLQDAQWPAFPVRGELGEKKRDQNEIKTRLDFTKVIAYVRAVRD